MGLLLRNLVGTLVIHLRRKDRLDLRRSGWPLELLFRLVVELLVQRGLTYDALAAKRVVDGALILVRELHKAALLPLGHSSGAVDPATIGRRIFNDGSHL